MPVIEELNDTFYRQELNSFLNSFVTTQDAIDAGQAPPTAPTSAQQVLKDIQEIWKGENPPLHPADLREALAQKYMPDTDPELLKIYSDVERSRYEPDKMTGFMQKPHLGLTSGLGHLYAQSTGRDVAMIEVDFSNMGGTNELYRALEAEAKGIPVEDVPVESVWKYTDDSAKLIAKTMQAELQHILPEGATLMPVRSGGDELRIIATGLDPDQYETVSRHIHSKIETHMAALDLHDHEHLKAPGNDVKNGFGAAFTIVDMNALDPAHAVELADEAIKAKKIELGHMRLGSVDEAEIREVFTEFFDNNPDKIPDGMTKDVAVDFLVENEKAHSQAKNAEFSDLKQTTSDGPKAKSDYIDREINALDIDETKSLGGVEPDYLKGNTAGDNLFAPPAEQRAQAVQNRINNNGVTVANDYETNYLKQLTQSTTARDPSADAWMPNDLPETVEIYARDTERLKAQMLLEGANVSPEQINSMKPQIMGVSFHNLGGLNDAIGHDGANVILKHMSQDIIGEALKQEGIMPGDYQIAHYGGAEFEILVKPAVGEDGQYKVIDEDVMKRVQNNVEMRTEILQDTNIVDFMTEKGMPPTAETQEALANKAFSDVLDVKPDRNISGIFAVTHNTSVEYEGRAGKFVHNHREALDNNVDAQRAKIIQENGIQPRGGPEKSVVPELDEFKQKIADYEPTSPQDHRTFLNDMNKQLDALYDTVMDREDMDPELQDKALAQIHDEMQELPAERNRILQDNIANLPEDQQRRLGLADAAEDSAHFTVKYGNHRTAVSLIMYNRGELTGDEIVGKITDFGGEPRDLTVSELVKTFEDGTLHSSNSNSNGVEWINHDKVDRIVNSFDLERFFDPSRDGGEGIVIDLREVEANTTLPNYADVVDVTSENVKFSSFLYEQTYDADAPDNVSFAKNVASEPVKHSVANEVQSEINRVFANNPNAIEALGGQEAYEKTLNSVSELDTKFEDRGGALFRAGDNPFETGQNFTDTHVQDFRENGRPSLVTQAIDFADQIGLDKDSPEYKSMIMVATRAEVESAVNPAYHNKFHYSDVTAFMAEGMLNNNKLAAEGVSGVRTYTPQEMALGFTTALGHDLDHPGKGNPQDDIFFNERASFEEVRPFLEEAGLSQSQIEQSKVMFLATSPTEVDGIVKEAIRAHHEGREVDWDKLDPEGKYAELRPLVNDPVLAELATGLTNSDLSPSTAGPEANKYMSGVLTDEVKAAGGNIDFNAPPSQSFFLNGLVGQDGFESYGHANMSNHAIYDLAYDNQIAMDEIAAKEAAKKETDTEVEKDADAEEPKPTADVEPDEIVAKEAEPEPVQQNPEPEVEVKDTELAETEADVKETTPEPKPDGAETPEVEKTAQTGGPDVPSGGKINAGVSSAGVAMAGLGFKHALDAGDGTGMAISGTDMVVSTADMVMDGASAFGKTVAPALHGIAQKANIGVMIADGVWQISREEGLDNKVARGTAVGVTTGTAMGVGTLAATVTTTGALATGATVVAPVAAAVAVGIAMDEGVEARKVTKELDEMFDRNEQADKTRFEEEANGAPKLQNFKNLNVYAIKECTLPDGSKGDDLNFRDRAKIFRNHNFSEDPEARAELREMLEAKKEYYDKIIEKNESAVPDYIRTFWPGSDDKIDKVRDARIEGATYKAALKELDQFEDELEQFEKKQELAAKAEEQAPEVEKPETEQVADNKQDKPKTEWEDHFKPDKLAELEGKAKEEFTEAAKPEQGPKPDPELVAEQNSDPSMNAPGFA